MQKYITATLLMAGMLFATNAFSPTASAQKDKVKVDPKGGAGHIEIGKGKDSKFRFSVRDADGKYLAGSSPHATEKECREAIETFRKVVATAKVSMKKDAKPEK